MTSHDDALCAERHPDDDTKNEERAAQRNGRPVSDGPGRHHANADTTHSPAPAARVTHSF